MSAVAGPAEGTDATSLEPTPGPTPQRKKISTGEGRLAFYLIAPAVTLLLLVVLYPVAKAVYSSFLTDPGKTLDPTTGQFSTGGGFAGIDNYKYWLFQQCKSGTGTVSCPDGTLGHEFWNSVFVTVFFTVISVVIETALGMGMALLMNREMRGRALIRAAILIPWAIPTAVTAKLWTVIYTPTGVLNAILGTHYQWTSEKWPARFAVVLADVWKTTPFMALLILAGLQGISGELYEAARVDGASAWQRFTRITLPLVKPALAVAVIFRTLDVLRIFDLPWILTQGANGTSTLSILVVQQLTIGVNSASALSTITFLFIFAVAFLLVRLLGANLVASQTKDVK